MTEPEDESTGYKVFDWEQFERICSLPPNIKQEDIAYMMKVSADTCQRKIKEKYPHLTFAEFRRMRQSEFKVTIMDVQYEVAVKDKNVTMLKWLGQNYLGQSDKTLLDAELEDKNSYNPDEL
jgi:hypothetical protein